MGYTPAGTRSIERLTLHGKDQPILQRNGTDDDVDDDDDDDDLNICLERLKKTTARTYSTSNNEWKNSLCVNF
jgi:hypothetical protein